MSNSLAFTILHNELEAVRARRQQEREKSGRTLTDYDEPFEEAAVYQQAIINMLAKRTSLGQAILAALWHIYSNGLVSYLGEYNPEDFKEWAQDILAPHEDPKYIAQLVFVVERVLQRVHQQHIAGKPFVTSDGEIVTVEMLIERYGLISKLIAISSTFSTANRENQRKLLDAVVNKSRRDVDAAIGEVNGNRIQIKLPYREILRHDGTFDIVLEGLNHDQVTLFQTLLGDTAELVLS